MGWGYKNPKLENLVGLNIAVFRLFVVFFAPRRRRYTNRAPHICHGRVGLQNGFIPTEWGYIAMLVVLRRLASAYGFCKVF